uniref:Glyoxylate reductase/hydroxypyruvate reductase-like n=1 Tax=Scophthalmus maximus TaxID=52904 RepID=A0A8D3A903_SCOMX
GNKPLLKTRTTSFEKTELLQDPKLHGPEIQAMFTRSCCPTVDSSLLSLLPSLKVVSNGGAGVDHLDVPFITGQGVKVTNTPGAVSGSAADVAMLLLLASARKIVESKGQSAVLPERLRGVEVTGSTLGIIGMGEIGYKIAQRKCSVNTCIKSIFKKERVGGATFCESLDDLLRRSDFVVIAVGLAPDTRGLISHRELSRMKPGATLVNISRGQVVDHDALVKALQSGTIRAAALDVTHPKPLPRGHPLLGLRSVLITPHIGGNTYAAINRMSQTMLENALAAVTSLPVPNEVKSRRLN